MSKEENKFNFFKSLKKTILNTEKDSEKKDALSKKNTSEDTDALNLDDNKTIFVKSVSPNLETETTFKFKGISSAVEKDIKFAENFIDSGGKFIFAENMIQVVELLDSLKEKNKWNHIFPVDFDLKELMTKLSFQPEDKENILENSDAAISFCYSISADEGVVILSPEEATSRKLSTFPENHIIIAFKDQLKSNIEIAVKGFQEIYDGRLPSVLELYPEKPVSRTYHKSILNAEGPKNVFLFYIDSEIE